MTTFLALYRGRTVAEAQLVALSADADIVADVANRLLESSRRSKDTVMSSLDKGRDEALHEIAKSPQESKDE